MLYGECAPVARRGYRHRLNEYVGDEEGKISARALSRRVESDFGKQETLRASIGRWLKGGGMERESAERLAPFLGITVDELLIKEEELPRLTSENETALRRLMEEELSDVMALLERILARLERLENGQAPPNSRAAP
jgi:hypothetical protein